MRLCRDCHAVLPPGSLHPEVCDRCDFIAPPEVPPGYWNREPMRSLLAAGDLRGVCRQYRHDIGPYRPGGRMSQADLALLTGVAQSTICRLERGDLLMVDVRRLRRFAAGLGIPTELVPGLGRCAGALDDARAVPNVGAGTGADGEEFDVDRGEFLRGMFATTGAALLAPLAAQSGRRIGMREVAKVNEARDRLIGLDDRYGGSQLWRLAEVELNHARDLRNHSSYSNGTEDQLALAVGKLSNHAAWLAHDGGQQDRAEGYWSAALAIGHSLGDRELTCHTLSHLSVQALYLNRPREALQLAEAASREAKGWGSPALQTLMAARLARVYAFAGDGVASQRAILSAERLLDRERDPDGLPPWATFYWQPGGTHPAELSGLSAMSLGYLGRHERAIPLYEQAVAGYRQAGYARNVSLYQGKLAVAYLHVGELEQATQAAARAVSDGPDLLSARAIRELEAVLAQLPDTAQARQLRAQINRHTDTSSRRKAA
jgi:tetratricopeptide (TPR) repeat protein